MTLSTGLVRLRWCAGLVALISACVVIVQPCAAQEPEVPEIPEYVGVGAGGAVVVTPETAAWWAAQRNTGVRIQEQAVPQAEGQLQQAGAADGIQVGVSASAVRMGPVTTVTLPGGEDEEPVSFDVTPDQMYQATVSARKPLYTGGRVGLGERIAREGIDAARSGTEAARLSVAQAARSASYGVLRTVQLAGVAAAQVTAIAEHVRFAEAMEEAGLVPHFDVVQARTELARAQEQLITAQTAIELTKAQLRQVLALPQDLPLSVSEAPPPLMPEGMLPELIDLAQANRPEVAVADAAVRMARLNERLAGRDMAPTVAVTGQYTRQTEAGLGGGGYSWQIGVVAEKPILDGGLKRGKVTTAEARVQETELQLQAAQEQVALEVVQAWLAVQEAGERIETAHQGLVEARERRRMAQLRYREGLASGIEVIDADTALAAAEASLVNAEYDRQLAVTRLRTAMGVMAAPRQEVETQ
ncbi:MAG: TolC family protein [Armatimonadota bacterium]|jgi:outer membrane protein